MTATAQGVILYASAPAVREGPVQALACVLCVARLKRRRVWCKLGPLSLGQSPLGSDRDAWVSRGGCGCSLSCKIELVYKGYKDFADLAGANSAVSVALLGPGVSRPWRSKLLLRQRWACSCSSGIVSDRPSFACFPLVCRSRRVLSRDQLTGKVSSHCTSPGPARPDSPGPMGSTPRVPARLAPKRCASAYVITCAPRPSGVLRIDPAGSDRRALDDPAGSPCVVHMTFAARYNGAAGSSCPMLAREAGAEREPTRCPCRGGSGGEEGGGGAAAKEGRRGR